MKELHHDGEHDVSPPESLGMIQARERYKGDVRHVLNALLHPRRDTVRLAAIQEARHLHGRQDVVQSGSVQLICREGKKIVIEKLRLLLRGKRREFESQPPRERLDERPGIGAIEAALRRRDPLIRMRTADDESPDPFWRIFRHAPPDPPSHRVPQKCAEGTSRASSTATTSPTFRGSRYASGSCGLSLAPCPRASRRMSW